MTSQSSANRLRTIIASTAEFDADLHSKMEQGFNRLLSRISEAGVAKYLAHGQTATTEIVHLIGSWVLEEDLDNSIDTIERFVVEPGQLVWNLPATLNALEENEKIARDEQYKPEGIVFGDIVCPRCNQNRVKFWGKQARSADEATDVFFQCVNCDAFWKG